MPFEKLGKYSRLETNIFFFSHPQKVEVLKDYTKFKANLFKLEKKKKGEIMIHFLERA